MKQKVLGWAGVSAGIAGALFAIFLIFDQHYEAIILLPVSIFFMIKYLLKVRKGAKHIPNQ